MYSELGGRLSASMEENDDPPVSHDHTLRCSFYHPPFRSAVLSNVVAVVSQNCMDDTQELSHDGHERPHFQHASTDEAFIILVHDAVLSDHLDSGKVEDLSHKAPPPFRYPPLSFSLSRAYFIEVEAGKLDDLRLSPEL